MTGHETVGLLALVYDQDVVDRVQTPLSEFLARVAHAGLSPLWRLGLFEISEQLQPVVPFTEATALTSQPRRLTVPTGGWGTDVATVTRRMSDITLQFHRDEYRVVRTVVVYLRGSSPGPDRGWLQGFGADDGDLVVVYEEPLPTVERAPLRAPHPHGRSVGEYCLEGIFAVLDLLGVWLESRQLHPLGSARLSQLLEREMPAAGVG